ncbi:MAG: hypothetical protein M0Q01_12810 [Syntrophales bacterium]|jgi:hypothetical protein|nr:hypothetical protein [Syntrophales bacterium]
MKIRSFIPACFALFVLLASPLNSGWFVNSLPHGGLVGYCCLDAGKQCTMICCGGCKAKTGGEVPSWTPELIFASLATAFHLRPDLFEVSSVYPPESVCLDVPVKPPIAA